MDIVSTSTAIDRTAINTYRTETAIDRTLTNIDDTVINIMYTSLYIDETRKDMGRLSLSVKRLSEHHYDPNPKWKKRKRNCLT